jgi:predicted Zn-dependent protease
LKELPIILVLLLVISSCAKQVEEEVALEYKASSSSQAASSWKSSAFPLKLKISTAFSSDEKSAIQDMGGAWKESVNDSIQLFDTSEDTSEKNFNDLDKYDDATLGIYKITKWDKSLPNSALAVTQLFGRKKNLGKENEYIEITHADILMNYDNFDFSTDGSFGYDFQTVVLHEMGHFLGLYHSTGDKSKSVMYPSISSFTVNRLPKQLDADALASKYSTQAKAMPARALASKAEEESEVEVQIILELHSDGKCRHKIH